MNRPHMNLFTDLFQKFCSFPFQVLHFILHRVNLLLVVASWKLSSHLRNLLAHSTHFARDLGNFIILQFQVLILDSKCCWSIVDLLFVVLLLSHAVQEGLEFLKCTRNLCFQLFISLNGLLEAYPSVMNTYSFSRSVILRTHIAIEIVLLFTID